MSAKVQSSADTNDFWVIARRNRIRHRLWHRVLIWRYVMAGAAAGRRAGRLLDRPVITCGIARH
jgi:hypothetical protein